MLEVRILGMQKEPTGLLKGCEIHDCNTELEMLKHLKKAKNLLKSLLLI